MGEYICKEKANTLPAIESGTLIFLVFSNLSMKYLVMCKVYTDVGGIK